MAQIDTSIYGQIQQPQFESPLNALAKVSQVQNAQNQNKLTQMKMQGAERELGADNALASLLAQGGSTADIAKGLASQGYGKQSIAYSKQAAEQEKANLEAAIKKQGIIAQYAGSAKDQQSWTAAKQALSGMGVDVSKVPDQYDPATAQQLLQQSLTGVQQLEQHWKQKQYDLDTAKFGYQQQNDAANRSVTMRGQNMTDARGQQMIDVQRQKIGANGTKPLPAAALKLQQEDLDAIGAASSMKADLGSILGQIQSGKLDLGPVANLISKGKNAAGMSSESSRNFASFRATLEKARNDSLRLNKGVQTDGDAQRAWNELFNNLSDSKVVEQRLKEIQKINERGVLLHKNNIDVIRSNYGKEALDTSGFENVGSALGGGSSSNIDSLLDKYK